MRILLVDDEEPMVELLASFSTREGREVTVCTSSLEAFSRIAAAPPDVLITDIVMAQLDGLSLVREARKIDAHLEAIVITGFGSAYPMEEVLQCGASDLILKPVRMREFRQGGLAIERRRVHRAHGAPTRAADDEYRVDRWARARARRGREADDVRPPEAGVLSVSGGSI